jgi:hypothetical protein
MDIRPDEGSPTEAQISRAIRMFSGGAGINDYVEAVRDELTNEGIRLCLVCSARRRQQCTLL